MDATAERTSLATSDPGHGITFGEAFRVWLRVALLSFGGPAGQIAVMHRILVEEKNWVSENRFLHALNYCMLLYDAFFRWCRDATRKPTTGRPTRRSRDRSPHGQQEG